MPAVLSGCLPDVGLIADCASMLMHMHNPAVATFSALPALTGCK
jgi:hypothetical protein